MSYRVTDNSVADSDLQIREGHPDPDIREVGGRSHVRRDSP